MSPPPLLARFLLDAQDEFVRTLDHVPNPGRGGRWGRLNASGWVGAHLAFSQDNWINVLCAGGTYTPWIADWAARQREATLAHPIETTFDEARAAFLEVAEVTAQNLEGWDTDALDAPIETPRGPVKRKYLVARACAHAFVHMGELSVIASLAGADETRLPGALARCREATDDAHETGMPTVARLLLDGYDEVARTAPVLSAPARIGAFERLNAGSFVVAHIGEHEDRVWNVTAQDHPRDAWMEAAHVSTGDPRSAPDFAEAIAAVMRVRAGVEPHLESLRAEDLGRPLGARGSNVGAELVRSAAHCFAHAGELMAIASLFGAEDVGQPGMLAHVAQG